MIGDSPCPPAALSGKRKDRQLNQREPIDHEVEQADFVGMNHIFASGDGRKRRKKTVFWVFSRLDVGMLGVRYAS